MVFVIQPANKITQKHKKKEGEGDTHFVCTIHSRLFWISRPLSPPFRFVIFLCVTGSPLRNRNGNDLFRVFTETLATLKIWFKRRARQHQKETVDGTQLRADYIGNNLKRRNLGNRTRLSPRLPSLRGYIRPAVAPLSIVDACTFIYIYM